MKAGLTGVRVWQGTGGYAKRCKNQGVKVVAIAGSMGEGAQEVYKYGIESIMPIVNKDMCLDEAISRAGNCWRMPPTGCFAWLNWAWTGNRRPKVSLLLLFMNFAPAIPGPCPGYSLAGPQKPPQHQKSSRNRMINQRTVSLSNTLPNMLLSDINSFSFHHIILGTNKFSLLRYYAASDLLPVIFAITLRVIY